MRINELHLDNFGHFRQKTIGPISDTVTVFYGPNESGKSTLLAFIRGVLFGFPRQYNTQHYPSLSRGDGGRITLSNDRGIYVIDRKAGPSGVNVIAPDGPASNSETVLRQLTGTATLEIFRNVFAFSLDELQSVASLNNANEIIYNAGQGAPGLPAFRNALNQQKSQIYLPRGNNQEVPQLLNALRDVDGQLQTVAGNAGRYGELTARKSAVDAALTGADAELSQIAARRAEILNLLNGWQLWVDLSDCERQLRELPRFERFPENPIPRLDGIEDRLRQAREDREAEAARRRQAEAEAAAEIPGEALLPDKDHIESIRRARGSFDNSVRDLPERQAELRGMEANLAENLADTGHGWSEAELQAFDTSVIVRNQAAQWKQRLDESEGRVRESQFQLAQERRARQDRQDETREAQAKRPPDPPPLDAAELTERQDALRSARGSLAEYERQRQSHENLRTQLNALAASRETAATPARRFNSGLLTLLALAALLLAAAGAAGGYLALGVAGGLIMGVIGLAVLLVGAAALRHSARPAPAAADTPSPMTSALAQQTADAESAAETARQSLLIPAAALGLDGPPDVAALDSAESRLTAARTDLDAWNAANAQVADAVRREETQQQRLDAAAAEHEAADAALQEAQAQWQQWLAGRNLDQTLTPEAMHGFLAQVETARALRSETEGMRHRVAAIVYDIEQFRQQVAPLAARHNIAPDSTDSPDSPESNDYRHLAAAADELIRRLDEAQGFYSQREQAGKQAQEIRQTLESRQQRVAAAERERAELLAAGETDDPEEFRRRARQGQERQELERQREECRRGLERLSGPGDRLDAFRQALAVSDSNALEAESNRLSEQHQHLESRRDDLREERGGIDAELARLTGEEESSALRLRRHALVEQLRECAGQWSRLTIAEALLEKTRQKFEQERQPSVIRHAQDFFADVTGQRYRRLYAPIGEQTITVTDANDTARQPTELSRGTREQLYLALRFGLIREFGEHAERLPVIVDEALVNFDPARATLAAQAFAQLSQTNQVLVFTCHPATADLFAHAADAPVVDLGQ